MSKSPYRPRRYEERRTLWTNDKPPPDCRFEPSDVDMSGLTAGRLRPCSPRDIHTRTQYPSALSGIRSWPHMRLNARRAHRSGLPISVAGQPMCLSSLIVHRSATFASSFWRSLTSSSPARQRGARISKYFPRDGEKYFPASRKIATLNMSKREELDGKDLTEPLIDTTCGAVTQAPVVACNMGEPSAQDEVGMTYASGMMQTSTDPIEVE